MKSNAIKWGVISIALISLACPSVQADVTSPRIKGKGKQYTTEKPDTSTYGNSSGSKLVEASELRIQVENLLSEGEWQQAIPKAKKAVQLDPGDPQGHIFLARALTLKFYHTKGEPDEKTLHECMMEWEIIRRHDADPTEQWEAGNEVKRLRKIAKAIEKDRQRREQERLERGGDMAVASGKAVPAKKAIASVSAEMAKTEDEEDSVSKEKSTSEKGPKKSRWRIF